MEKKKWQLVAAQWRYFVLIFTPIFLSPLLIGDSTEVSKCAFVMILVAIFWMTEVTHLAVTSMLPVVLFPLVGILTTNQVASTYMNSTNMIFFGGITMALAVEYSRLHERIALFVILKIGQSPSRLMLGFVITTMLLSMWISNTAATAMMLPIIESVISELYRVDQIGGGMDEINQPILTINEVEKQQIELTQVSSEDTNNTNHVSEVKSHSDIADADDPNASEGEGEHDRLRKILLLSVAFSANLGGTGTLTGTNPNIVLSGFLEQEYGGETELNYATWLMFGVPTMLLATALLAIVMHLYTIQGWKTVFRFFQKTKSDTAGYKKSQSDQKLREESIRSVLQDRFTALGPMSFHEKAVAVAFTILVLLWITMAPYFVPGWAQLFVADGKSMVAGAVPAILMVFLLFVIPARLDSIRQGKHDPSACLLTWKVVKLRFPWEVLLVMGGGFALAKASSSSGLSVWISEQLRGFSEFSSVTVVFLLCLLIAAMTNVMSNTAVISIFLPVLKELASVMKINPLYLMLPATFSASFAFMFPVATPPNTLVFEAGRMSTLEMAKIGFVVNILSLLVITFFINTWGLVLFDLNSYPSWANTTIPTSSQT